MESCRAALGGAELIVSKCGMVTKANGDKVKRRLILDSTESGITDVAKKNQRIILPDVCDIVLDALKCMDTKRPRRDTESQVHILIMDATEAFWSLVLRREEMRFFVGRLRRDQKAHP